jgi:hypothetical protein
LEVVTPYVFLAAKPAPRAPTIVLCAQYDGQCSFFGGATALPAALGWFIVAGLGLAFALLTSGMVWLDQRYNGAL